MHVADTAQVQSFIGSLQENEILHARQREAVHEGREEKDVGVDVGAREDVAKAGRLAPGERGEGVENVIARHEREQRSKGHAERLKARQVRAGIEQPAEEGICEPNRHENTKEEGQQRERAARSEKKNVERPRQERKKWEQIEPD
jgi:hypothetical protein